MALRSGEQVTPTRGATLCRSADTARRWPDYPDPCESSDNALPGAATLPPGRGPRRMRVRNDFADTGAEPLLGRAAAMDAAHLPASRRLPGLRKPCG